MTNINLNDKLPEFPESLWLESLELPNFPQLEEDIEVDVTVVGGGITGITTAYLLANEGLKVALIEADRLMNGTTGHTTAKVTAQHNLIYDELISTLGKKKAKLYYEANTEALNYIKNVVSKLQIDCDFKEQDAFIYATTKEYEEKIQKEAAAYKQLGIDGELTKEIPFNINIKNAITMKNQAQFHPIKYLNKLVRTMMEKDVHIYENTTAVKVEKGKQATVEIRGGASISSDFVLICSHFPFYEGKGLYSNRMYADRSYALATKTKSPFPGGMYVSAESPTRSLRSINIDGQEMVLVGGESHKTGQDEETTKHYQALQAFGEEVLGLEAIPFHWSAQDLITLDKVPYIGAVTADMPNVLLATGYRKWGMTTSTVAALLFRDIILGKENRYEDLYKPSRFPVNPSVKSFAKIGADVVTQLVKGKLEKSDIDPKTLENDEGAVITLNGKRSGAYKDVDGELHIVDTTCTHIGCEVNWNDGERTWDCPCHGSRFSYTGEVIEGPAEKPLKKRDYKMIENLTSDESGY